MKKLIIILLPILIFILGTKCYAFSESDVSNLRNAFYNQFNVTLNETYARNLLTFWEQNGNNYPYMGMQKTSSNKYAFIIGQERQGNSTQWGFYGYKTSDVADPTTATTITWAISSPAQMLLTMQGNLKIGPWSSWHTVPIDWQNPLYSIAIKTPSFEVTYRNILYNEVDVPLNVNMTVDQQSELYCEVMAEYTLPNNLQYRYSSNSFEASQYTRISKTIVSADQLVKARTLSASGLYAVLKNKYAECLQELPLSNVSIRFPSDFSAQEILDARDTYDELRQVCTVGGTAIKIYIRYFSIENDTQFVVGAWRIWNSVNPKTFGVELPSWYQPYIPASGDQGTNTTTDSDPDVVVIPAGGQSPTGQYYDPSINITVGNNVPNYPDYPTIATYNLDNMLVDTMNNVRGLSSFFGEFGSFLTLTFSFFPAWIWAIIGVGFSISIVVMFLKIL